MSCSGPNSDTNRVLHTTDSMAAHGSKAASVPDSSMLVAQYSAPHQRGFLQADTVSTSTASHAHAAHAAAHQQLPHDKT
jgi:hypothetical protein